MTEVDTDIEIEVKCPHCKKYHTLQRTITIDVDMERFARVR